MATLRHHFRITLAAPLLALAVSGNVYSDEQIEFVRIPGGCFQMGSQKGERHELPLRKICVDSFEIGKFEVTQAQWKADMGTNPSHYSTCGDNCPVEQVSWNDAQEFVRRLNAKAQGVFRLPTEAEWEYACRSGGKDEEYAGGVDPANVNKIAWYREVDVPKGATHPVGQKESNGLGVHDMNGNVWEWVQDTYVTPYSTEGSMTNPVYSKGKEQVLRGGSYDGKIRYVRCSIRNRTHADRRDLRLGVRIVREVAVK